MADLATPSAATMGTINAGATPDVSKQQSIAKPEKPDEASFKAELEKLRKALVTAQESTKAAQDRVSSARPGNKDSPIAKRQQELRAQLSEIRTKQQGFKTSRLGAQDKIKALDSQLKAKIQEQKTAKARIPFKSVEEIDREIAKLDQQVDSGKMKLVDEKKALADITALRKHRKAFAGFDESQKSIDEVKNNIAEIRKELENPEYKSLSDEYTKIQQELDTIKAEQDSAFKDLNTSRDALTKARANQDQKYADIKQHQDNYYQSLRAYRDYDREAQRQREVKRKAERDAYILEKKRKDFDRDLEEASWPAYGEEIKACDNLIRVLDPSSVKSVASTGPGLFAAVAQRTIDATGLKGTRLSSKKDEEEDSYFIGGGGKKGKKGKKSKTSTGTATPSTPTETKDLGKFFDPGVVQQFETIGVSPPSSQEEISTVLDKVKEKREFWTNDQQRKTKENIAAAQKKLDRLLSGAADDDDTNAANGVASAAPTESTNEALQELAKEDGHAEMMEISQANGNDEVTEDISRKMDEATLTESSTSETKTMESRTNGEHTNDE